MHLVLLKKLILKCIQKGEKSTLAKMIMKKNKVEGLLDFKNYYKAVIIKQYDTGIGIRKRSKG